MSVDAFINERVKDEVQAAVSVARYETTKQLLDEQREAERNLAGQLVERFAGLGEQVDGLRKWAAKYEGDQEAAAAGIRVDVSTHGEFLTYHREALDNLSRYQGELKTVVGAHTELLARHRDELESSKEFRAAAEKMFAGQEGSIFKFRGEVVKLVDKVTDLQARVVRAESRAQEAYTRAAAASGDSWVRRKWREWFPVTERTF